MINPSFIHGHLRRMKFFLNTSKQSAETQMRFCSPNATPFLQKVVLVHYVIYELFVHKRCSRLPHFHAFLFGKLPKPKCYGFYLQFLAVAILNVVHHLYACGQA